METQNTQNPLIQSTTLKMVLIAFLAIVLLVPLELVKSLIDERTQRKQEVVSEVTQMWGRDIQFYGPILRVPYKTYEESKVTDEKTKTVLTEKKAIISYAYFFPEKLNNKSQVKKNTSLKRSIYKNVVFVADMQFDGAFSAPNYKKLGINPEDIMWNNATILVKTTNLKSIKSDLKININGQKFDFESKPSTDDTFYNTLETNAFDYTSVAKNQNISFNFSIRYNGSESIQFIPLGKTTTVSMNSDWNAPSFFGTFSTESDTKKITKNGFHADWKIRDVNRAFSQQYADKLPDLKEYSFGVKLIETVDQYQQNERAAKYGFLVICLTFMIFFLIQTIAKIKIHIFHYTMLGLALVMFYTLLISITEHTSFSVAYLIASLSVITMIVLYVMSILKNNKFTSFVGLALLALYAFIFVIIQLETYALLVGSIGLFLILGAVMYFSRKIDWGS
jgi:inner membrane protein